ncbi:MAG: hypothetical protein JSV04_04745 [Candidatus Heimdallarchaeota archaeon]|nr:MAG: hypothetical protein JSV04_04745 [Candidatus Heimdallarchaeota archaeon]
MRKLRKIITILLFITGTWLFSIENSLIFPEKNLEKKDISQKSFNLVNFPDANENQTWTFTLEDKDTETRNFDTLEGVELTFQFSTTPSKVDVTLKNGKGETVYSWGEKASGAVTFKITSTNEGLWSFTVTNPGFFAGGDSTDVTVTITFSTPIQPNEDQTWTFTLEDKDTVTKYFDTEAGVALSFQFSTTPSKVDVTLRNGKGETVYSWGEKTSGSDTYEITSLNEGTWSFTVTNPGTFAGGDSTDVTVTVTFGAPIQPNEDQTWTFTLEDKDTEIKRFNTEAGVTLTFHFSTSPSKVQVSLDSGDGGEAHSWSERASGSGTFEITSLNEGTWSFTVTNPGIIPGGDPTSVTVSVAFSPTSTIPNQEQTWDLVVEDQESWTKTFDTQAGNTVTFQFLCDTSRVNMVLTDSRNIEVRSWVEKSSGIVSFDITESNEGKWKFTVVNPGLLEGGDELTIEIKASYSTSTIKNNENQVMTFSITDQEKIASLIHSEAPIYMVLDFTSIYPSSIEVEVFNPSGTKVSSFSEQATISENIEESRLFTDPHVFEVTSVTEGTWTIVISNPGVIAGGDQIQVDLVISFQSEEPPKLHYKVSKGDKMTLKVSKSQSWFNSEITLPAQLENGSLVIIPMTVGTTITIEITSVASDTVYGILTVDNKYVIKEEEISYVYVIPTTDDKSYLEERANTINDITIEGDSIIYSKTTNYNFMGLEVSYTVEWNYKTGWLSSWDITMNNQTNDAVFAFRLDSEGKAIPSFEVLSGILALLTIVIIQGKKRKQLR